MFLGSMVLFVMLIAYAFFACWGLFMPCVDWLVDWCVVGLRLGLHLGSRLGLYWMVLWGLGFVFFYGVGGGGFIVGLFGCCCYCG